MVGIVASVRVFVSRSVCAACKVQPVRIRLCHDRREEVIARHPLGRCLAEKGEIGLRVVTDGELVVLGAQPTIARTVVVLNAAAGEGVIRVEMATPLIVREVRGRVWLTGGIEIRQTGLLAVSAGQPPQEVIERAILHSQDDNMLDIRFFGPGQIFRLVLRLHVRQAKDRRE